MKYFQVIFLVWLCVSCSNQADPKTINYILYDDLRLNNMVSKIVLSENIDQEFALKINDQLIFIEKKGMVTIDVSQNILEEFRKSLIKTESDFSKLKEYYYGHVAVIVYEDSTTAYSYISDRADYFNIFQSLLGKLDVKTDSVLINTLAKSIKTRSLDPKEDLGKYGQNIFLFYQKFNGIVTDVLYEGGVMVNSDLIVDFRDYNISADILWKDSIAKKVNSNEVFLYKQFDNKYDLYRVECPEIFESCRD